MSSAAINLTASATVIQAPVPTKRIRVTGWSLNWAGTQTATWQDTAGSPGTYAGPYPSGLVVPMAPKHPLTGVSDSQFDVAEGLGLVLTLTTSVQVGGHVTYEIVS
jgi:hypothetical protein